MPLLQHQKSRNRGFTLLELLIVMVIVAMMVTMVVLSVNLGRGDSALKDSARRLHAILQLASEESILFNKSLGIKFEEDKYSFYELVEKVLEDERGTSPASNNQFLPQANSAGKNTTKKTPKKEKRWEATEEEGENKGVFSASELPDYHQFSITIEGTIISLKEDTFEAFNDDKKKEIKPTLFITPDGEIFPDFEIQVQHQDSDAFASIKLNEDGELELEIDDGEDL